jgi:hypothetical protein
MPLGAPFRLGPFTVDEEGLLSPRGPDSFPSFRVHWQGRTVQARLTSPPATLPGEGKLELQARLGRVPSTADADPAQSLVRREKIFTELHDLASELPGEWHLRLAPDHSIRLDRPNPLAMPTSAVQLVTEVTLFLLALGPYLEVLDAAGVDSGAAGKLGTVKTWPG